MLQLILKNAEITDQDLLNKLSTGNDICEVIDLFSQAFKRVNCNEGLCSSMCDMRIVGENLSTGGTGLTDLPEDVLELIMKYSYPTLEDKCNSMKTYSDLYFFNEKLTKTKDRAGLEEYRAQFENKMFKCVFF